MVFSSLFFLFLFLPLNLVLYYLTRNRRLQNLILVVFSLIFYAWGEPVWISLLVVSSFIDYLNGLFIEKYRGRPLARLGLYSTLFFNLGFLMTFKYSDFIIDNINAFTDLDFAKPGFLLPIGISFYTFQTISYTIDVYRGEVKAQKSFLNFLLFVSLFHQLVAGPIVRYSHIAREINERVFKWKDFSNGISRLCIGLFKKVYIANAAGALATQFLDGDFATLTTAGAWLGIVLYSVQIYFDFSGYSDMAIGMGWMFGFHYHENFKYPYVSTSVTDFWRRWHISLSSFFRDYVYIPLGGNKSNRLRNILVVWSLTGLWHGASWNFVLWGLYFGILLLFEKWFVLDMLKRIPRIFSHAYALFFIVTGWGIFYFTDLSRLAEFMKVAFRIRQVPGISDMEVQVFDDNVFWMILTMILCLPVYVEFQKLLKRTVKSQATVSWMNMALGLLLFAVSVVMLVGSTYNPFIYFRF